MIMSTYLKSLQNTSVNQIAGHESTNILYAKTYEERNQQVPLKSHISRDWHCGTVGKAIIWLYIQALVET